MPNSFASVRAALKTKLQSVGALTNVYDYHIASPDTFPCASFDVSDNSDDFLTNTDNFRTITFVIVIYQERNQITLDTATEALDAVVDSVISTLENDFQLKNGGAQAVDWCDPVKVGRRVQFDSPNGAVIAQELGLTVNYAVQINNT